METPEKQEELQTETSFDSVKESASDVLGGLMGQIKRLEEAMKEERMGDVYQIYWNELPASIQQSSNANHEIDNFLTSKLDQEIQRTIETGRCCKSMLHNQLLKYCLRFVNNGKRS